MHWVGWESWGASLSHCSAMYHAQLRRVQFSCGACSSSCGACSQLRCVQFDRVGKGGEQYRAMY